VTTTSTTRVTTYGTTILTTIHHHLPLPREKGGWWSQVVTADHAAPYLRLPEAQWRALPG
jgi:hypothetical protein